MDGWPTWAIIIVVSIISILWILYAFGDALVYGRITGHKFSISSKKRKK